MKPKQQPLLMPNNPSVLPLMKDRSTKSIVRNLERSATMKKEPSTVSDDTFTQSKESSNSKSRSILKFRPKEALTQRRDNFNCPQGLVNTEVYQQYINHVLEAAESSRSVENVSMSKIRNRQYK